MRTTSIRVSPDVRDQLAVVAKEMGAVTLDAALASLLFRHRLQREMARLAADPVAYDNYIAEGEALAEVDVSVPE